MKLIPLFLTSLFGSDNSGEPTTARTKSALLLALKELDVHLDEYGACVSKIKGEVEKQMRTGNGTVNVKNFTAKGSQIRRLKQLIEYNIDKALAYMAKLKEHELPAEAIELGLKIADAPRHATVDTLIALIRPTSEADKKTMAA